MLTDRGIQALKPAAPGGRYVLYDTLIPPLGVRVSDKGRKTFVVYRRRAGEPRPVRIALGTYPLLTLEKARERAKLALEDLVSGRHPKERERQRMQEEARRRDDTVAAVADEFIRRHVTKLRTAKAVEASIRHELLGQALQNGEWIADPKQTDSWRDRPIIEITRRDVIELMEAIVDRGTPHQARKVLAYVRKLFNWAIARDRYGLAVSPCDRVRPRDIVGKLKPRQRVLTDHELELIWRATEKLPYPFGPFVRMLLVTGQRLREVSDMRWSELGDLDRVEKSLWTLPPERMKGDASHEVPLSPLAVSILSAIPRYARDIYVFSTTEGRKPIRGFSKAKAQLDAIVDKRRKEAGGGDAAELPRWTYHDCRRTVRTRLSELRVPDLIGELILAHRRPELHETYDLHKYRDEKRDALSRWATRLQTIVEPPPPNVVALRDPAASQ